MDIYPWIRWSDFGRPIAPLKDLIKEIEAWPLFDALHVSGMIDLMLEHRQHDPEIQLQLLHVIDSRLTESHALVQRMRNRDTILFHPQARFALVQLVLRYGDESQTVIHQVPKMSLWQAVLKGLLKISDHINGPEDDRGDIKQYILQSAPFTWITEPLGHQVLRSYELFAKYLFSVPQLPNRQHPPIGFNAVFQAEFGVTVHQFAAQMFAVFAYLSSKVKATDDPDPLPYGGFIGTKMLDQNPALSHALDAISRDAATFRELLNSKPTSQLLWYNRDLASYPLIKTPEGAYFVLSSRLLSERMGRTMFYTILDALPKKQRPHFLTHFGRVFEAWVKDKLVEVIQDRSRLFLEDDFPQHKDGKYGFRPSEAIVIYPEANILWEAKAKRIVVNAYETGDLDVLRKDVREGIGVGIGETAEVAKRIREGELLKEDVVTTRCLPVIVTAESYPIFGPLAEEMLPETERPAYLLPYVVLDSGSFQILCQYAKHYGMDLHNDISDWQKKWKASGYTLTMVEFLQRRHGPLPSSSVWDEVADDMKRDAIQLFHLVVPDDQNAESLPPS